MYQGEKSLKFSKYYYFNPKNTATLSSKLYSIHILPLPRGTKYAASLSSWLTVKDKAHYNYSASTAGSLLPLTPVVILQIPSTLGEIFMDQDKCYLNPTKKSNPILLLQFLYLLVQRFPFNTLHILGALVCFLLIHTLLYALRENFILVVDCMQK